VIGEPASETKESAVRGPLWALVLLWIAASAASAAGEKAKPNTLVPKEIADGWILLFDGETTFGWKIEGEAKVENEVLVVGGAKATKAETTTAFDWQGNLDHPFEMETSWEGEKPPRFLLPGNEWASLNDASKGKFFPQKVTYKGATRRPVPPKPLAVEVPAGSKLLLRNVKYRPLSLNPIFNGKDLSGWKEIAGRPSKYTVTANGELNVKNGPGDLQTEGQWADFILQLDVIANGKHLNSGVFFRCLPGQFWSGYEAQIRNQWQGDDRTKPVDFGTGAIYNRQPARKVVSDDGQWFTMTIIAQGNHMAVWVNGYQVTDFTDTRPPRNNARRGAKLDQGPISLQGHDPTTNLSFRNMRVAELPGQDKGE
jgi:hypothetical protein